MGCILYRIQDEEGRGPYRPGVQHLWMDADHDARNPTFFEEFGLAICNRIRRDEHAGCAFIDLDQLRCWFSARELTIIQRLCYRLVKIEASRIIGRSEKQLVFTSKQPLQEAATVVGWESLREQA